jgi:hypothetical protein
MVPSPWRWPKRVCIVTHPFNFKEAMITQCSFSSYFSFSYCLLSSPPGRISISWCIAFSCPCFSCWALMERWPCSHTDHISSQLHDELPLPCLQEPVPPPHSYISYHSFLSFISSSHFLHRKREFTQENLLLGLAPIPTSLQMPSAVSSVSSFLPTLTSTHQDVARFR